MYCMEHGSGHQTTRQVFTRLSITFKVDLICILLNFVQNINVLFLVCMHKFLRRNLINNCSNIKLMESTFLIKSLLARHGGICIYIYEMSRSTVLRSRI